MNLQIVLVLMILVDQIHPIKMIQREYDYRKMFLNQLIITFIQIIHYFKVYAINFLLYYKAPFKLFLIFGSSCF
jgi:hypothetical protein